MHFLSRGLVGPLALVLVGACETAALPDAGGGLDVPARDTPREDASAPDVRPSDTAPTPCTVPADCQDGVFCNGAEACAPSAPGADARGCTAGTMPCASPAACDEASTRCTSAACDAPTTGCTSDAQCDDGAYCSGTERCVAGTCTVGMAVTCTLPAVCVEAVRACGEPCTLDAECDDGLYCNGSERCSVICRATAAPCGSLGCDEAVDACRCAVNADCGDTLYCNGLDYCRTDTRACATIPITCASGSLCLEGLDRCAPGGCTMASQCDAGIAATCETCNVATGACVRCPIDADRDGAASPATGGTDCDDTDPLRAPGRPEVCDAMNRDEDCDPTTFGIRDGDGDGSPDARCCNEESVPIQCGGDCDDSRIGVHPSATETCNGIDDDCDTGTDEGVSIRVYRDRDGDGDGDETCAADLCPGAAGWAMAAGDCDDERPTIGIGSSICDPDGLGVLICSGGWTAQPCPAGTSCRPQPDGTGLCL